MNPLLDFSGLPRFADFKPEFVEPAVSQLLGEVAAAVDEVTAGEERPTWDSLVTPLDDAIERLRRAWGQVAHLNAVMNSPQLREVYNANLPKVTQMFTELAQNESLFQRYKALKASPEFEELDDAQRKFIDN
ncbi:MAG: oligopeptidase A, partial [Burkholderiales bacterium]